MTNQLTATGIASLACQQFIHSSTDELAIQFTTDAISLIDELRQIIWNKISREHQQAKEAISKVEKGEKEGVDTIAALLRVEMRDKAFATQVKNLVLQINVGKILDSSNIVMNVSDKATEYQMKNEDSDN